MLLKRFPKFKIMDGSPRMEATETDTNLSEQLSTVLLR